MHPIPAALLGGCLLMLAGCERPAYAHDRMGNANWIANGGYTSPVDGSHCCGVNDCVELDADDVTQVGGGYHLRGMVTYGTGKGAKNQWIDEFVPAREVQTSRDGKYWRCNYMSGVKQGQRAGASSRLRRQRDPANQAI